MRSRWRPFGWLRLNDIGLIPVAGQALLAQGLFELAERVLVSKGLRL